MTPQTKIYKKSEAHAQNLLPVYSFFQGIKINSIQVYLVLVSAYHQALLGKFQDFQGRIFKNLEEMVFIH